MKNWIYRHRVAWLAVISALSVAVTLWLATRTESVWASLLMAVISGGLISVVLAILIQKLDEDIENDDIRRALVVDLALNVRWARYNKSPLTDQVYMVWVPFRVDAFMTALGRQNRLNLSKVVYENLLEATDRMHAFNQDWASYQHSFDLGRQGVRIELEGAMKRHATELYYEFFPRIILALLPDAEPACRSYGQDWDAIATQEKG